MISVVTWLWNEGFRDYRPEHINACALMFKRGLSLHHNFVCIADESNGLDAGVNWIQTPEAAANLGKLRSPEGARFPSCYRRLWMFSNAAKVLGDRVLLIDLDLVLTGDITPLFDRKEDFVGWRPHMKWGDAKRFGGGLYLLTPGTRTAVYDKFDGLESIRCARSAGYRGSDQAWISYCLAAQEASWSDDQGIYSIRDIKDGRLPLPEDARLVQFNGPQKPWNSPLPWVQRYWPQ